MSAGPAGSGVRTVRFDPHVHTVASYDAHPSVESVLTRAAAVGLDAVAVTDHDTVDAVHRAERLADETDLLVVPGVEVSTADGHLLALGLDERPEPGRAFDETVAAVRDAGGLAVVPHPFQWTRHGVRRQDLVDCDGVEVHNACSLTGYRNRQATQFAAAEGYPVLAGSDAHAAGSVGRAYTAVEVPADADLSVEALLDAVRRGRTRPRRGRITPGRYLRKYATNLGLKTALLGRRTVALGARAVRR